MDAIAARIERILFLIARYLNYFDLRIVSWMMMDEFKKIGGHIATW